MLYVHALLEDNNSDIINAYKYGNHDNRSASNTFYHKHP